jgi:hypothetical protein
MRPELDAAIFKHAFEIGRAGKTLLFTILKCHSTAPIPHPGGLQIACAGW